MEDDEIDDFSVETTEEQTLEQQLVPTLNDDDLIFNMLKDQGIEDPTKIKFEDEEGNIQEKDWNTLSNDEKYNILNTNQQSDPDYDLDDAEVQLINAIRTSNLTPAEYLESVSKASIQRFVANNNLPKYSVDELNDDELYVLDLLSKAENLTDDEALDVLQKAKDNSEAYLKQVDALRTSYRLKENEQIKYLQAVLQQQQLAAYTLFANSVKNSIENLTEISGYDLNLDNDERDELFEFLTGFDNAGNSWFGKALNDPNIVVKMAYYALNGDKMIDEISQYYQNLIKTVRQNSYNKGLLDAKNGTQVVYKPKDKVENNEDYIDDF